MNDPHRLRGLTVEGLRSEGLDWLFDASFLGKLEPVNQESVLARARWRDFRQGDVLIEAGAVGADVHLIVAGQALVTQGPAEAPQIRARLGPGHMLGERAHLRGEPTTARVTALSPIRTLTLAARDFEALLVGLPTLRTYVEDLVELRERSAQILDLLLRDPVLRSLGREDLEALMQAGQVLRLPAGSVVVRAGQRNHDVFLVVRGRVAVYAGADGARELIASNGPGWLFGYAAVLLDLPRTADIETTEYTELLRVGDRAFMELVSRNPPLQRRLYQHLADLDLRTDDARARVERPLVLSMWSAHRGMGTTTLAYGLAAAMRARGPVTLIDLDGAGTAQRLGLATRADRVQGVVVDRAEVPPSWGAVTLLWPRRPEQTAPLVRALRSTAAVTDTLIVVMATGGAPDPETIAATEAEIYVRWAGDGSTNVALEHGGFRVDAVRMQDGVELPMATTRNAVRLPDDLHTAQTFWRTRALDGLLGADTPLGRATDRMARVLLGRTVGIALGGGGALGFAHISLLRALHEAGIPVDYLAGSSFGAVVGGLYASGGLPLLEQAVRQARTLRNVAGLAMLSTRPLEAWTSRLTGGRALGNTEIPFFPVALDVLGGAEVVITGGTVAEGVRASCGFPLFYQPTVRGVRRLVDGGIVNNVPASVIWDAGANFIIGSNIIPRFPAGRGARLGRGVLKAVADQTVARFDDLLRSVFLMMSQIGRDRSSQADYIFELELQGFLISDFAKGAEILDASMDQARRAVADIACLRDQDGALRLGQR